MTTNDFLTCYPPTMDETVWDGSVIRTDVQTVAELARTALNHSLELLRLLPAPIPTGSRVYASLEAIRSIPLQAKANPSVGVQVDFISQQTTQPEDSNISLEYEIINITPDKQYNENPSKIELTEPKLNNVAKLQNSLEADEKKRNNDAIQKPKINDNGSKLRQTKEELQENHTSSESDDAEIILDIAKNYDQQAKMACPSEARDKLSHEIQIELFSKNSQERNYVRDRYFIDNKFEAEILYERAYKALLKKNFDEALELAVESKKSYQLAKTEVLKRDIMKARNARFENTTTAVRKNITTGHEHLIVDVEKCNQVASNQSISADLEKAEKFVLSEAEKIQPTEKAIELLECVPQRIDHQRKVEQTRLANEAKAEPLVACAVKAISEELYEVAGIILMNAWIRHKSSTAKQMLEQVEEIISMSDAGNANTGKNKKDKSIEMKMCHRTGAKVFELANFVMTNFDENFENVECILIVAQNIYPTKHAKDLLIHIRKNILSNTHDLVKLRNKLKYYKKPAKTREYFQCNNYVEMAQSAFVCNNYNIAKEFLLEADKVVPAKDIKKLIKHVECEIRLTNFLLD